MTPLNLARTAYATARTTIRTDKRMEYDLFTQITRDLVRTSKDQATAFSAMVRALNDNRRLWTLIAIDLASPENALPDNLKARLLSLAAFTETHTEKVLCGAADVSILVEINQSVMRGLNQGKGIAA